MRKRMFRLHLQSTIPGWSSARLESGEGTELYFDSELQQYIVERAGKEAVWIPKENVKGSDVHPHDYAEGQDQAGPVLGKPLPAPLTPSRFQCGVCKKIDGGGYVRNVDSVTGYVHQLCQTALKRIQPAEAVQRAAINADGTSVMRELASGNEPDLEAEFPPLPASGPIEVTYKDGTRRTFKDAADLKASAYRQSGVGDWREAERQKSREAREHAEVVELSAAGMSGKEIANLVNARNQAMQQAIQANQREANTQGMLQAMEQRLAEMQAKLDAQAAPLEPSIGEYLKPRTEDAYTERVRREAPTNPGKRRGRPPKAKAAAVKPVSFVDLEK